MVGMVPYRLKRVLLREVLGSAVFARRRLHWCSVLTSSWMLQIPGWLTLLFGSTVVVMSFALCGIAVGIGALFPNFSSGSAASRRDDNPAKIVSGFGGTFCFILSLVYVVVVIGAEVAPMYASFAVNGFGERGQPWGPRRFLDFRRVVQPGGPTSIPMSLAFEKGRVPGDLTLASSGREKFCDPVRKQFFTF